MSRTVSYALVAGLLLGVVFGVVAALTTLLPAKSDLAIAGSTLPVAALFTPVRRRVQGWVDRRFNLPLRRTISDERLRGLAAR